MIWNVYRSYRKKTIPDQKLEQFTKINQLGGKKSKNTKKEKQESSQ